MDADRRRSPRVWTSVWVCLDGVDAEMRPRSASVSATGIYFEYERDIGDPGTVEWLVLASADRVVTLQIMASVVRSVTTRAKDGREVRGAAFEFMPESDEAISQLRDFLHYVLALAADGVRASEAPPPAGAAGVRSFTVESDWSVPVGTPMRVEIIAKGIERTTRVEGRAARVTPIEDGGFRIEIAAQKQMEGPLRRFSAPALPATKLKERVEGPTRRFTPALGIPFAKGAAMTETERHADEAVVSEALEGLIGTLLELREQPKPEARSHLAGELSRIRLPALLSMIDIDKMTGELLLLRGSERRTLFVRRGRVLDVEPAADAKAELASLLAWHDGDFAFTLKAVIRPDRIATKTSDFLAEHAEPPSRRAP